MQLFQNPTRLIFVGNKFFSGLLEAMFNLLAFIFCKELDATALQLTLLIASKSIVGLLSLYGNLFIKGKPHTLKGYIILLTLLGTISVFLFPFVQNAWFFLGAYALFMLSLRAAVPAWTEILKINHNDEVRASIFSQGSALNYLINIAIPLSLSPWMDVSPGIWKWIFFALAFVQIINIAQLFYLKVQVDENNKEYHPRPPLSIIGPWRNFFTLLRERKDFRNYQILFMIGGFALLLIQPVLPVFFKETVKLSYTQLTIATHLCKGIVFALSSPLWGRLLSKISIYLFNFYIYLFALLSIIFISISTELHNYINIAYIMYGIMHAGYELNWNLSGPIFSREKESTLFTSSTLALMGARGCIAPFIGQLLFIATDAITVFACAGLLCLIALMYSLLLDYQFKNKQLQEKMYLH